MIKTPFADETRHRMDRANAAFDIQLSLNSRCGDVRDSSDGAALYEWHVRQHRRVRDARSAQGALVSREDGQVVQLARPWSVPSGAAQSGDGRLFISTPGSAAVPPALWCWDGDAPGACKCIVGEWFVRLAADAGSGVVWALVQRSGGALLAVLDAEGNIAREWVLTVDGAAPLTAPCGLAVADGGVFVLDGATQRVVRFDKETLRVDAVCEDPRLTYATDLAWWRGTLVAPLWALHGFGLWEGRLESPMQLVQPEGVAYPYGVFASHDGEALHVLMFALFFTDSRMGTLDAQWRIGETTAQPALANPQAGASLVLPDGGGWAAVGVEEGMRLLPYRQPASAGDL